MYSDENWVEKIKFPVACLSPTFLELFNFFSNFYFNILYFFKRFNRHSVWRYHTGCFVLSVTICLSKRSLELVLKTWFSYDTVCPWWTVDFNLGRKIVNSFTLSEGNSKRVNKTFVKYSLAKTFAIPLAIIYLIIKKIKQNIKRP